MRGGFLKWRLFYSYLEYNNNNITRLCQYTSVSHPGSLREWRMGSTDPVFGAPVGSDSWEFVIYADPPTCLGQPVPHHLPRSQPLQIPLRQRRARLLWPPGRPHTKAFCLETTSRCKERHSVVKFDSNCRVNSAVHRLCKAQFFTAVANVIGVATRLRAGLSRNRGSILGRVKKFISSLQRPDRLFWIGADSKAIRALSLPLTPIQYRG
jgi:hypothetical protein